MTFQRRLGLAFALMAIPLLLVAALAYRSNRLEREALENLGQGLGRSRTYAEVESALQAQGEIVWRALSGFEEDVPRELATNRQVVTYWIDKGSEYDDEYVTVVVEKGVVTGYSR